MLAHTETLDAEKVLALCTLGAGAVLASILAILWLVMRKAGFLAALVLAALSTGALGYGVLRSPFCTHPWITDVSTDVVVPPPLSIFLPAGQRPAAPRLPVPFAQVIRASYPDLTSLHSALPPAELLPRVAEVVRQQPNVFSVRIDDARGLIHAVEIWPLLRFRDDFTVRVIAEGPGSRVDMRSRSRVGKTDLGVNAARIRRVLEAVGPTLR